MIKFIKNLLKLKNHNEREPKFNYKPKDYDKVKDVINLYFKYLDYSKYNIKPLDVDSFCKELEMNEEDIAKVHKAIKERKAQMRIERLAEDF